MKKNRILFLIAGVLMLNFTSCKENLPDTPTIVTGKVIDQNGTPLKGARIFMVGSQKKGITAIPTFDIFAITDSSGNYVLSQLLPKNTDYVEVQTESTDSVRIGFGYYSAYFQIDGKYLPEASPYKIPYGNLGKTTTLNYKFIK